MSRRPDSSPNRTGENSPLYFRDMTAKSGVEFRNLAGESAKPWIPESIGQGVLMFDYDSDGDLDLGFANGGDLCDPGRGPNALYRNDGDWRFTDVSATSGLDVADWTCGMYAFDWDADGHEDVYLTQLGTNRLFRNVDGSGRFVEVPGAGGADSPGFSTSATFFDADADGDLDLYVCNYLLWNSKKLPEGGRPCDWKGLEVFCGPRGLPAAQDRFYERTATGFVDATERFGFELRDSGGRSRGSYSLGVTAGDLDGDGDTDVYVAVDSQANLLFENQGSGRFRERGLEWQVALNANAGEQAGMGVAMRDLDGDERLDLFVTNFSHDTHTLYLNASFSEGVFFDDMTSRSGLGGQASYAWLSWGTGIHDFDLDGRLDIFVASGHVYPQIDDKPSVGTSYAQPNQLYTRRGGSSRFIDCARDAGPGIHTPRVSRGAAFGDLDRDGLMDVVVANLDDRPTLLRNESRGDGSWLALELVWRRPENAKGIGSRLSFVTDDGQRILREMRSGGSYLSGDEIAIHLGLAPGRSLKSIEITWPDGEKNQIPAPNLNGRYRLVHGEKTCRRL